MKTDLPLVHVELGVDDHNTGAQRILAIFGVPGKTLVRVRVPVLRETWVEVLRQSLEASRATLEV